MKIKDIEWNIEYEYDCETNTAYKYLTCYHTDGTVTINKFNYAITKEFSKPY